MSLLGRKKPVESEPKTSRRAVGHSALVSARSKSITALMAGSTRRVS
jgi:hypothetical protein